MVEMTVSEFISAFGVVGGVVMAGLGVIITIDKVLDIFRRRNPTRQIVETLKKHEELLERDRQHLIEHDKDIKKLNSDFASLIAEIKADNIMIKKTLFAILDGLTGDANRENLKEAKAELLEHISK